ncbi:CcmD family protein [Mucilaginibacter sp. HMF5004]|uniref:CcmD family protein n=1 Tax=Mucilaginibacter rivuli TaxID=2857527 RepID=UPI001C5CE9C6|nr:CcmD family protein [Mucilaginibacter rivuli]MBW4889101.1 CcmD family protein [Mucilaginibacter rivuli]
MKKIFCLLVFLFTYTAIFAQADVEMADTMRSSGKIYVVITTIAIVFVGLAIFLFAIERRVKKLEDQNKP